MLPGPLVQRGDAGPVDPGLWQRAIQPGHGLGEGVAGGVQGPG